MHGATSLLPQYVFMEWCLVKHRDNFTFLTRPKFEPVPSGYNFEVSPVYQFFRSLESKKVRLMLLVIRRLTLFKI
jgi:hypothetical protein